MKARIEKHDDNWRVIASDGVSDGVFEVSSINDHCESKLQAMLDAGGEMYVIFETITEYCSDEYRARISPTNDDWYDEYEDAACLLREYVDDTEVDAEADRLIAHAQTQQFIAFPKL